MSITWAKSRTRLSRRFAQVKYDGKITYEVAAFALDLLEGFGAILVNLPLSGAITQGDTVGPISALLSASQPEPVK